MHIVTLIVMIRACPGNELSQSVVEMRTVFPGSFYLSRDICSSYNNFFDVKECRAKCSVDKKFHRQADLHVLLDS